MNTLFTTGQEPKFSRMLLLSAVVHVALFALIFYSTGRPGRILEGKIYTVDIVTLPLEKARSKEVPKVTKAVREKPVISKRTEERKSLQKKAGREKRKRVVKKKTLTRKVTKTEKTIKVARKSPLTKGGKARVSRRKTTPPGPEDRPSTTMEKNVSVASELDKIFSRAISVKKDSVAKKVDTLLSSTDKVYAKPSSFQLYKKKAAIPRNERELPTRGTQKVARMMEPGVEDTLKEGLSRIEKTLGELKEGEAEAMRKVIEKEDKLTAPTISLKTIDIEIKARRSTVEGEVNWSDLARIIKSKIQGNWELDEFLTVRKDYVSLKAIVTIKVSRHGNILEIIPVKKSANPIFQESVIRAIKASDPLPVTGYLRGDTEITLSFNPEG